MSAMLLMTPTGVRVRGGVGVGVRVGVRVGVSLATFHLAKPRVRAFLGRAPREALGQLVLGQGRRAEEARGHHLGT